MKFGFELEAFCVNAEGEPVLTPDSVPHDECGWLAEVRSEPHTNIRKAIHLLMAECDDVEKLARGAGCKLEFIPLKEIPRDLKVKAARRFGKGVLNYKNIYGFETHRNPTRFQTASLHISFTNELKYHFTDEKRKPQTHRYQGFVDHAKLIVGLDKAFKTEIQKAKRNPGFYEIKPDGRIEYRSLPNDVSLSKVGDVLNSLVGDCDGD